MSGRGNRNYRGRSKSRGRQRHGQGRGGGRGGGNNNKKGKSTGDNRVAKFTVMKTDTMNRFQTYAEVLKQLIRELKKDKDLQDVAKAMEAGEHWRHKDDEPQRKLSKIDIFDKERDPTTKKLVDVENTVRVDLRKTQQEGYDMKWKAELSKYSDRVENYKASCVIAYNKTVDDYCTQNIFRMVEQQPDFETKIKDNPVALLEILKSLAHEGGAVSAYRCPTIVTTLERLVTLRMNDDEHPSQWKHRVTAECDAVTQLMGDTWLEGVIQDDEDYKQAADPDAKDKLASKLWDEVQAYMILHGAQPQKYGQLKRDLRQSAVLKDEKYPKNKEDMTEALVRHTWDRTWYDYKNKQRQQQRDQSRVRSSGNEATMAQNTNCNKVVCFCCGKNDHVATSCPKRDEIPKD